MNKNNYHFQYKINTSKDISINTETIECYISAETRYEAREILTDRLRYLGIPIQCIFIDDEYTRKG